jgi:hypothetical protein
MDLRADYDDGYFDKDEQGWCARRVKVTTAGERITIDRSGDDNGARPYAETITATIGAHWPELGLVKLVDDRGRSLYYFDTRTNRLRHPGEQVHIHFAPPANYRGPGCLAAGLAAIVPVAAALDMHPGPPPTEFEIPPRIPSTCCQGAIESQWQVPGAPGYTWRFLLRDYPADSGTWPECHVIVQGQGAWVSLYACERASFLFYGPLELYPAALVARDRAIAEYRA